MRRSDEELMRAYQAGDVQAFDELFTRHSARVYGYLRSRLADPTAAIVEAAKRVLERTPPELSADLAERGIVLAGGGASLGGLDLVLREETGIPVFVAESPLLAVVTGVGMVLDDLERYRGLLF